MENTKKISIFLLVVTLILIFIVGSLTTFLVYNKITKTETQTMEIYFEVTDKRIAGLSGDRDALRFGVISQGSKGVRFVDINHYREHPLLVTIILEGKEMSVITVSENNFILQPEEKKQLTFYAIIPSDFPIGNYTGKAIFSFKKANRDGKDEQ